GRGVGLPGVRPRDTYRQDNQGGKVDQYGSVYAGHPCAQGELRLGTAVSLPYALAPPVPARRAPVKPGLSLPTPSRACHRVVPEQDGALPLLASEMCAV